MDGVHFLNVEYILLKLGTIFWNIVGPIWGGAPGTTDGGEGLAEGSSSFISSELWFTLGQIGLAGMALAFILLVISLYIRIKLELFEHEEFHKRDAKYHAHTSHAAHGDGGHGGEIKKNARWEEIMRLASSGSESDWRRAIMEADIMLGEVLDGAGYRGSSIGEKLKDANPLQMTTLDLAWKAHKVRNDIAHGGEGFHLSEWDTKAAIDFYRRVFEEFKFI
jgi:hypothetical protein